MIFILIFLDVINGTVIYKNVLTKKKNSLLLDAFAMLKH